MSLMKDVFAVLLRSFRRRNFSQGNVFAGWEVIPNSYTIHWHADNSARVVFLIRQRRGRTNDLSSFEGEVPLTD